MQNHLVKKDSDNSFRLNNLQGVSGYPLLARRSFTNRSPGVIGRFRQTSVTRRASVGLIAECYRRKPVESEEFEGELSQDNTVRPNLAREANVFCLG
ncbi:hypothetical protein ElyMa_001539500 [Elysia marginata]|uniref:Uncharacterized protein n=1 Tax=Elysia marginata TaxID=1093978 RepID=A0AAV4JDV7_9GAST|nr:hypothetical protein ElyMa_001539500 [Elysia marginata]